MLVIDRGGVIDVATGRPAELVYPAELAERLECSERTICRRVASGSLPLPLSIHRRVAWPRELVEAWLGEEFKQQ